MKKNPKLQVLPETDSNWSDQIADHPLILWIANNGKILLYSLLGLVLLTTLGYRLLSSGKAASEANYIQADKDYIEFANPQTVPEKKEQAYERLINTISYYPDLHAKYDGLLAQALLIQNQPEKALLYANSALKRTSEANDPFYSSYASATILVAENKKEEALKKAQTLKEQMIAQGTERSNNPEQIQFGTLLYAMNLLRIGMLQQDLSLNNEELATWQEWKELARKSQESSLPPYLDGNLFLSFEQVLGEGQSTFANYIDARENALKNSLKK